jgi:prepilin-type N-terminal cleavage/methylation domain-containing protein
MSKSFTLIELLIVLIIIGVLATISFVHQGGIRDDVLDKEARANLKLIVAAEKVYSLEMTSETGYLSTDIGSLNRNLKLSLPAGPRRNWNYGVYADYTCPTPQGPACCVEATRHNPPQGSPRIWNLLCRSSCGVEPQPGKCRGHP